MTMTVGGEREADQHLLDQYVKDGSSEPFGDLVARYAGLVQASARRQLRGAGREHLIDDVTQAVFMVLARRAGSIRDAAVLPAWLIKTTYFASRDAIKIESRRRRHEHKAAEMTATRTVAMPQGDVGLSDIAPILDAALARLKPIDRALLTRRFLQQQSVEQVAVEMKMSEDAVRKRVSRALPTLRVYLTRRGVTLSLAALAAALAELHGSSASAAQAATLAADALKPIALGNSPAANAVHIARRVLARMSFRPVLVSAALLMCLMLACAMALAVTNTRPGAGGSATPASGGAGGAQKIKVGFMISDYTATGPGDDHGLNIPQGLDSLLRALRKMDDPEFDRFAILEPNTAAKGRIPTILRQNFPTADRVLDGTSVDDLRKLDVIVCPGCLNMRDDVLNAITTVVTERVGLLNQDSTGCNRPGLTEAVNRVNGMTRYGCLWNPIAGGWDCDVVGESAILAGIKPGQKVKLQPDFLGSIGIIRDGQPLLAAPGLPNLSPHHIATTVPADTVFYPMYVSHLGQGNILCLQWNTKGNDASQPVLEALTAGRFYPRCIEWLANRPVR
jgi:RNA polymerase sigma factor (sigma-70 family)